jgi:hypothetical protein
MLLDPQLREHRISRDLGVVMNQPIRVVNNPRQSMRRRLHPSSSVVGSMVEAEELSACRPHKDHVIVQVTP